MTTSDDTPTGATPTPTTGDYHPVGWDDPTVHGMALKFQTETDCRTCHAPDLLGDLGPACESCHGAGWENNCLWCHGGEENTSGAPPEGIDDSTGPQTDTFIPHTAHVDSDIAIIDCDVCHSVPTDALTAGHVFDDNTPGQAEVSMSGGSWASGSCTVYCHGDGQSSGTVDHTADPRDCSSCHADRTSPLRWNSMSGRHLDHLFEGLACDECHGNVVSGSNAVVDASLHVNGQPDLDLPLTYSGGTCSGVCHGENRSNRSW